MEGNAFRIPFANGNAFKKTDKRRKIQDLMGKTSDAKSVWKASHPYVPPVELRARDVGPPTDVCTCEASGLFPAMEQDRVKRFDLWRDCRVQDARVLYFQPCMARPMHCVLDDIFVGVPVSSRLSVTQCLVFVPEPVNNGLVRARINDWRHARDDSKETCRHRARAASVNRRPIFAPDTCNIIVVSGDTIPWSRSVFEGMKQGFPDGFNVFVSWDRVGRIKTDVPIPSLHRALCNPARMHQLVQAVRLLSSSTWMGSLACDCESDCKVWKRLCANSNVYGFTLVQCEITARTGPERMYYFCLSTKSP